jgi:fatty acid desaturase
MTGAHQQRVSRTAQDATERAAAAQASAETARFERLEQRVRRTIHGLFWILGALWMAGLTVIAVVKWGL